MLTVSAIAADWEDRFWDGMDSGGFGGWDMTRRIDKEQMWDVYPLSTGLTRRRRRERTTTTNRRPAPSRPEAGSPFSAVNRKQLWNGGKVK